MKKYIIIRQDVYTDVPDDIQIVSGVYNSLDEANDRLIELYNVMYDTYQVKLLNRDYLFCWKGGLTGMFETGYHYKERIYFRIKEIK